jgi:hypothetical protein
MLVFGLQEAETLSWDEFKLCYDSVYPEGQTWLPCGGQPLPSPRETHARSPRKHPRGAAMRPRAHLPGRRHRRPTIRVASASSSSSRPTWSTPPTPTKASQKVSPLRLTPSLAWNPCRLVATVNGSMLASTSSTRLIKLSRKSRQGSTTCSARKQRQHPCVNAHKRYAAASLVTFTGPCC